MQRSATFAGSENNALVGDWRGDPAAPGVLFLHGGGQTRHSWGRSAQALSDVGYRTLTLDHRGHGDSEWVKSGLYGLDVFAADTALVIESFDSAPAVVGASLGGLAAMVLEGLRAPGSFSSVVFVDVIPDMDPIGVDRIKAFMADRLEDGFETLEEAALAVAEYQPHRKAQVATEGLRKNLRQGDDGRWRWHWDPAFMTSAFGPKASDDTGYHDVDRLTDAVAAIKVPMQLVRGQLSDIVKQESAEQFIERFPHIEFVDVSDASHMVAGDSNDVFTEAVADFLARQSS
ncbi:MAG: alpha/beta hydrolase [Acidimicrobiales bacterium]